LPRIHPHTTTLCIGNSAVVASAQTGDDPSRVTLSNSSAAAAPRLDVNAHPLQYANDGLVNSFWLSTALQELTLSVDLGDEFQVPA